MSWLPVDPAAPTTPAYAFRARSDIYDAWCALLEHVPHMTDTDLLDLCQLRFAQLHGSRRHLAHASEERLIELEDWQRSSAFSEREQVALAYAEQWAIDASRLTHEQNDSMARQLRKGGIVNYVHALHAVEADVKVSALFDFDPNREAGS